MNLTSNSKFAIFFFMLVCLAGSDIYAQTLETGTQTNGSRINNIKIGVPFLTIVPDARASGMGDAGVAIQPDGNTLAMNPSKLAFLEHSYGFSASYSPWLKSLVPDVNLAYLSGYYKLNKVSAIGASMRYFSLGEMQLTDGNQQDLGIYTPNEFAFDVTYSRRFGEEFALGTSLRYIYSNLSSGNFSAGQQTKPGSAVAVDVSGLYRRPTVLFNTDAVFSLGVNISNIGTKIGYADAGPKLFIPTNLKLGAASTFIIDDYNQFTFALDFNKLLVPTQPVLDIDGNIVAGKDPDRSVPSAIFGSFGDAPGGFREEVQEVSVAFGAEYWYNQQFALRAGYFYEAPEKGNRRYFTLGAGLKYNIFNLDFAYLLANPQKSPLANTLRFTLLFNFGNTK